jgi:hypothetical protein
MSETADNYHSGPRETYVLSCWYPSIFDRHTRSKRGQDFVGTIGSLLHVFSERAEVITNT